MRTNIRFLFLLSLMLLCFGLALTACDGGGGEETTVAETAAATTSAPTEEATDVPTEAVTAAPTEEATTAPTEETTAASAEETTDRSTEEISAEATEALTEPADTETPTPEATEEATEPVTEAPTLMLTVDMDLLDGQDLTKYFTRSSKCAAELLDDEQEGKILRLSTEGISSIGSSKPTIYLKLSELVEASNGIMPATSENPYLVLKVRKGDVWSRTFGIQAGETVRQINTSAALISARVDDTDDWQYIYFDCSSFTEELKVFFLCFEYGAAKNGEFLDIAEISFVATREEAEALTGTDSYDVPVQTLDDYTLKTMSFNVQTENGTSVDFALRAEMLRDLLDELQPDSIGMQEVTVKWINWMDTFSFNDSYAGVGEGRTPGGEASSIYYRKDKFELVGSGTFWLSETPDVQGSAFANANYPRICTWAHLRDKATGFEYIHVNTHLDHNGNNSSSDGRKLRTSQVRVLLEYIRKLPDVPMVLTGDFNQAKTSSSDEIYAMYKNVLGLSEFTATTGEKITGNFSDARVDAKDTVSPDLWASMTSSWQEGDKYNPAKKPIDYVFYTTEDFDAMVYRNIHYHRDGIYMSDHLPQYCELHVKVAAEQAAE